ncbi:MAG TPA: hypothetical protein VGR62_14595 [Candidatus Binatia bacterium]|jgi:hypothetical protein|nr:hypothetical protein [Candidatus Binatia bacterium]
MAQATYALLDPVLSTADADGMRRLCEQFGPYGTYAQEKAEIEIGQGLAQRHDAVQNFLRSGGRLGRPEPIARLAARTNYFRESYAYGDRVVTPGIEPFLHHEGFVDAARRIHGLPVIEPAIVYANILLPGQELAVHTDVPEFRGANRTRFPQWLMVVMHHSRLFDEWRMPIVTAVSWFNDCRGGEFVFYPEGADGAAVALPAKRNSAIVLDTDSVFHGVDRVTEVGPLAPLRPGMTLTHGDGHWTLRDGDELLAAWTWDDIRFSVSWKAYCFPDEDARARWRAHTDDLELGFILDRLVADLRRRERLDGDRPDDTTLALTLIDEYVHFPPPSPS